MANLLRLLRLPEEVRADLTRERSRWAMPAHILGLADATAQRHAAREVIARALSVRETEALVKRLTSPGDTPLIRWDAGRVSSRSRTDVHTRAAEDRLRFALGTKVRIVRRGAGGTVEIAFASEDELNRLYDQLTDGH